MITPTIAKAIVVVTNTLPNAPSHSQTVIVDMFFDVYGRAPVGLELTYYQNRLDKDGAALLGAMQYAFDQGMTVTLKPELVSPETADAVYAEYGEDPVATSGAYNTVALDWDWTPNASSSPASNTEESAGLTGVQIWSYMLTYWPYEPMSNKGFHFYLDNANGDDPDYVVSYDSLSPEDVDEIHPGGVYSVRIRRIGGIGGAQVILDADGNVIPGAGSYDKISPMITGSFSDIPFLFGHFAWDYAPWWIDNEINNLVQSVEFVMYYDY